MGSRGAAKIGRLQAELSTRIGEAWVSRQGASLLVNPGTAEEVACVLRAANRTVNRH